VLDGFEWLASNQHGHATHWRESSIAVDAYVGLSAVHDF